jgi:hypothetical protein
VEAVLEELLSFLPHTPSRSLPGWTTLACRTLVLVDGVSVGERTVQRVLSEARK